MTTYTSIRLLAYVAFPGVAMQLDTFHSELGYSITRDGDTVTIRHGERAVDVPWSGVRHAERVPDLREVREALELWREVRPEPLPPAVEPELTEARTELLTTLASRPEPPSPPPRSKRR